MATSLSLRRTSKRHKGEQESVSVRPTKPAYLQPSPAQMRHLYDWDNVCAHQLMRAPLRECTSEEPPDQPGGIALSKERMDNLLKEIRDIWEKCSVIFEIFSEPDYPHLGYRLRVSQKLPMKLNITEIDRLAVGWKVVCPDAGPSSHLYQRSCMEGANQYLGGPISYCNWSPHPTVCVRQVDHGPWAHVVRAEIKNKVPGTELVWDYRKRLRDMEFDESDWFQSGCCSIKSAPVKPLIRLQNEVFQERCVLCGLTYRSMHKDATKRQAQKKVHFINFHSNYLGSDWNGYGDFSPEDYVVDVNRVQLEAERLNRLLTRLKRNNWHVVPACRVLNEEDLSLGREEALQRFREACITLKRLGTVVLRGRKSATSFEDLNPVSCLSWSSVFPATVKKSYAMLPEQMATYENDLKMWETQDSEIVLNVDSKRLDNEEDDVDE